MKQINVKRIFTTYNWKWRINTDICGICQQSFDQMCSSCKHPINCKPCVGACSHSFHAHCLSQWLAHKNICPMCRVRWEWQELYEMGDK